MTSPVQRVGIEEEEQRSEWISELARMKLSGVCDDDMVNAVLKEVGQIDVEEAVLPEPRAGELLIKVMACGVCGTDVHIFSGGKGAADNPLPIVLGHEFSGIVEKVGIGVPDIKAGDRVSIDPNVLCGHCYYCLNGIGHFCENMIGIGTLINGGFSQYCVVPFRSAYRISDSTSFVEGAMAEPLACCLHGIEMCNISSGDDVVIIGGGMIGLLMVQLAKIQGAGRIVLVEPVEKKRSLGQKLGADICIDPVKCDVGESLRNAGINRVSVVIECVGKPSTIQTAIEIAGKKSTVMIFGLTHPDETIDVKPFDLFRNEIEVKSSFINPYTISRAIALIDSKKIDVKSMIADCVPLKRLVSILSDESLRAEGKYIVEPWA